MSSPPKTVESSDFQDDTPGVKGEIMFVNTDSFEEYNDDMNTLYNEKIYKENSSQESTDNSSLSNFVEKATKERNEKSDNLEETISNFNSMTIEEIKDELNGDDDYLSNSVWLNKKKHIFILSESGKPIYSRHGQEDKLVTLFGLMQALVSFLADGQDSMRCFMAGGHKFVFVVKSPLIMVAVSNTVAHVPQILMQLTYVYNQVISVLTASAITRMFEKRRNYDFRNLLGGTERLLDHLLQLMECHPSFLLGAVQCLPLNYSVRDTITQSIIQSCSKIKQNLVFALIISENQLISLVRMKNFLLHPADLHLLFNLINSSESLKASENWIPICLPKFDSKGYLYGHVSYLSEDCQACLLLLSVDREEFYVLSEAKQKIVKRLRRYHCLEKINQSLQSSSYKASSIGSSELRHFMYKSKSTSQYTCPTYSPPYCSEDCKMKLFGNYQLLHHRIHSVGRPLKMDYYVSSTETFVGWVTKEFELYVVLESLTTKANTIACVNKILNWIKTEENKLFILQSATF